MPRNTRRITASIFCAALLAACAAGSPDPATGKAAIVAPYQPCHNELAVGGHWSWQGSKYVWVHGTYIERPAPTANWMPGYWEEGAGGWIWTEGHWET